MKKGISRGTWVDLTDGHEYHAGEAFPHDGREIPDKRWKEVEPFVENVAEVEEPKKKAK